MTTTVTVEVHCPEGVEVVVNIENDPCSDIKEVVIQNGEKYQSVVYDNKAITVCERLK